MTALVEMVPPWIKFPDIPRGRIGWRMGAGEDYWNSFAGWYVGLEPAEKTLFKSKFPELPIATKTKVCRGWATTSGLRMSTGESR
jgi:hypothetical protein